MDERGRQMRSDGHTLLADERERPGEHVHEVGQPVGVRRAVELADVHHVVLVLEDGSLVVVHVQVVGRREYGDQRREARVLRLLVHAVAACARITHIIHYDSCDEMTDALCENTLARNSAQT